jgi:transcriptional regulator with XRE-family HTH domain
MAGAVRKCEKMASGTKSLKLVTSYPAIVGAVLTYARECIGLSQKDLSEMVGLSQSTWSRIESGSSALTIDQLFRAARALGTLPGNLLQKADDARRRAAECGIVFVNSCSSAEELLKLDAVAVDKHMLRAFAMPILSRKSGRTSED